MTSVESLRMMGANCTHKMRNFIKNVKRYEKLVLFTIFCLNIDYFMLVLIKFLNSECLINLLIYK